MSTELLQSGFPVAPGREGGRRVVRDRESLQRLLQGADIAFDGHRPWDIEIHDPRTFEAILARGSLGAGESYMEGWWDCAALDEMFARVLGSRLQLRLNRAAELRTALLAVLRNPQSIRRSRQVARQHYDIGDDLYAAMLDPRMMYSCAYWQEGDTLAAAQERKLDLICRKLRLQPGMRVLDIGCGWGGAAQFAAERYGVEVVGCTISTHQAEAARQRCAGLPVEILLTDYRRLTGRFDRIFSIGMFEHVGRRNYHSFMQQARSMLAPEGLFLLHTIGSNRSQSTTDAWIERYIFPNSMLPSVAQIAAAAENSFQIEDWHSFGWHYDQTLLYWLANFDAGWPQLAQRYGERFRRMWRYYLLSCAGSFRARYNQLWQILLSPNGVPGGLAQVR
jgi:cyclopropane-fatty-acyl-phospholipid synthase